MKAMRSRWFGSMFAWILKTKPVIFGSVGSTVRLSASWPRGGGAKRGERVDQVAHAEIAQSRAEEHRREMALAERVEIEALQPALGELDLLPPRIGLAVLGEEAIEQRITRTPPTVSVPASSSASKRRTRLPPQLVGAGEVAAAARSAR